MTSQAASRPARTKRPTPAKEASAPAAVVTVRRIFAMESTNYFLLLGTTLFLVAFGLVMVLSSSSIESRASGGSFFDVFLRQGLFALVGIPLMLIASRMPVAFWKRMARPAIVTAVALQLLVFSPLGWESGGNRNWISLGPVNAQPSELVKLALIVWIAFVLSRTENYANDWRRFVIPVGAASAVAIGLVLIGKDLGTAVIMLFIVFGSLFFAGVNFRYIFIGGTIVTVLGIIFAFGSTSRTDRIHAWMYGCTPDQYWTYCWQPTHGTWALASGGIFGVGLGNSKAKWSWLPEADNDYIFAIIGEELGLIGAVVVLALFVVLAIAFIRIIRSSNDAFARIATSGVMVWIIGQALVNVAVVLGVLPVLGVPLPLISAGGSALISTLLSIGVVLSFARDQSPRAEGRVEQTPAERSRLAARSRVRS